MATTVPAGNSVPILQIGVWDLLIRILTLLCSDFLRNLILTLFSDGITLAYNLFLQIKKLIVGHCNSNLIAVGIGKLDTAVAAISVIVIGGDDLFDFHSLS